ncbi:MAG: uroporphyrinogen-III synthase, partial [Thermoplasmata archaeon]
RRAAGDGAAALVRSLLREPHRRLLRFRSGRAGPELARELRRNGHRVVDVVVYRTETTPQPAPALRREIGRADLWVVTSPSALSGLRSTLGPRRFRQLGPSARLVVLGERSRRAARGHGFRHVVVVRPSSPQRFTLRLLEELRHASA